jgi:spoIIIJ-associated protein
MEWVETTGRTIDEAKSKALDQLGVAEDDAEITILDEPKQGLFGRTRGEARVRARVRPTQARPKAERRDRRKKSDKPDKAETPMTAELAETADHGEQAAATMSVSESEASTDATRPSSPSKRRPSRRPTTPATSNNDAQTSVAGVGSSSEENTVDAAQVGDEAQRFLQGLVDAFGLTGTAEVHREGDEIEVRVEGDDLGLLVGPRGTTLQAVQELTRVAAQRRLGDHETRLRVDVAGYRERRRVALTKFAEDLAAQVVASGTGKRLEPMSSSDRKVIHDVLSTFEGVTTRSEGDDPRRCVVIAPAND